MAMMMLKLLELGYRHIPFTLKQRLYSNNDNHKFYAIHCVQDTNYGGIRWHSLSISI